MFQSLFLNMLLVSVAVCHPGAVKRDSSLLLYGNSGPYYSDVTTYQDYPMAASLASLAAGNPQRLKDIIQDYGDGTVGVTFTYNQITLINQETEYDEHPLIPSISPPQYGNGCTSTNPCQKTFTVDTTQDFYSAQQNANPSVVWPGVMYNAFYKFSNWQYTTEFQKLNWGPPMFKDPNGLWTETDPIVYLGAMTTTSQLDANMTSFTEQNLKALLSEHVGKDPMTVACYGGPSPIIGFDGLNVKVWSPYSGGNYGPFSFSQHIDTMTLEQFMSLKQTDYDIWPTIQLVLSG